MLVGTASSTAKQPFFNFKRDADSIQYLESRFLHSHKLTIEATGDQDGARTHSCVVAMVFASIAAAFAWEADSEELKISELEEPRCQANREVPHRSVSQSILE